MLSPGLEKHLGALPDRGPAGEDVIDQQDIFSGHGRRVFDRKGAVDVFLPLFATQADLGLGGAGTDEQIAAQGAVREGLRQNQGLVETPTADPAGMQRHRQDEVGGLGQFQPQGGGQPIFQEPGIDQAASVFKIFNGLGHRAVIKGDGPGPMIRWGMELTGTTEMIGTRTMKRRATTRTHGAMNPLDLTLTFRTDRRSRLWTSRRATEQAEAGQKEIEQHVRKMF